MGITLRLTLHYNFHVSQCHTDYEPGWISVSAVTWARTRGPGWTMVRARAVFGLSVISHAPSPSPSRGYSTNYGPSGPPCPSRGYIYTKAKKSRYTVSLLARNEWAWPNLGCAHWLRE